MYDIDAQYNVETLYRRILENPADDTVRLIYCDALDERGIGDDADKAYYIREAIKSSTSGLGRMVGRMASADVFSKRVLDWRRGDVCSVCFGKKKVTYGFNETVADCMQCGATGWRGVLWEREDDTFNHETGYSWGEWKIPAVWERGLISTITVPIETFASYAEPQWVKRLFLQWPIQRVIIEDAEPSQEIRHSSITHATLGINRSWLSGQFGRAIEDGYIPKPLFDIIKKYNLMTAGRDGALRALSEACVIWGRERAGLPFVDPREWYTQRHS